MKRSLFGALSALLLVAAGLFWWEGHAAVEQAAPPAAIASAPPQDEATDDAIPDSDVSDLEGPEPPIAREATREERRFNRLDRNQDGCISRNEMLAPRVRDFRKLDVDHNNLLTFEEWAVKTSNRFKAADGDGDGSLTRAEFASTRPRDKPKPKCKC
ncbi:MAG: hypothetical protein KGL48_03205 [Sphingomonadales bacterium]|nr:hypothetical protein [Sphingomonadales bacterium]MDE2570226.1 hypothetical protein [Sphingomonadales bacterium]